MARTVVTTTSRKIDQRYGVRKNLPKFYLACTVQSKSWNKHETSVNGYKTTKR